MYIDHKLEILKTAPTEDDTSQHVASIPQYASRRQHTPTPMQYIAYCSTQAGPSRKTHLSAPKTNRFLFSCDAGVPGGMTSESRPC